jgi:fructoselysine and glucoselysine-specific PTS system IID component
MMANSKQKIGGEITKKDLQKVFWRSFTLEASWNYERMQHMGVAFAMAPIIRKLYKKQEDISAALKRYLEFFNSTPHISTLILGISTAMEEENSKNENFDESSISSVKAGLMGPIAGIGDSFFWGTLRIIAAGIGTSLAVKGNILGTLLFILVFNIPHILMRYYGMMGGYKLGTGFLQRVEKSGLMDKVSYGAAILGLMVVGGMTATMVSFSIPIKIGSGENATAIQGILDGIIPALLPLTLTLFIYYLLRKKVKVTHILLGLIIFGILGSAIGLL